MPEPREAIKRMRPYSPPTGDRHEKVRLDFNENTVGCSPRVLEFLRSAMSENLLATYPDYEAVRSDLAAFFGVEESELALTNGTDEAIQLLVNAFVEPSGEVIVPVPSYPMYRFYAEVAGASVVEVPTPEVNGRFCLDRDTVIAAITPRTKAIMLASPNNPTGAAIPTADFEAILQAATDACVLADEAYFEFHGTTMLPAIHRYDNLFVSRTFSKAYGMAALRVGCILSRAENILAIRSAQSPYSVNMVAALAAREAIADRDFVVQYVGEALEGRREIESVLGRLGVKYWLSDANFVLFDAGDRADECVVRFREGGVLIRDRRHELSGALRVTAGPSAQMARFARIAEEFWGEGR